MRLIDADKLKKDLESVTLSNGTLLNTNTVLLLLDKYPTAYDVDNVVEQLDEYITKIVGRKSALYQTIIVIVKAGGNIELSEHSKSQGNRTGKQKATIETKSKAE